MLGVLFISTFVNNVCISSMSNSSGTRYHLPFLNMGTWYQVRYQVLVPLYHSLGKSP